MEGILNGRRGGTERFHVPAGTGVTSDKVNKGQRVGSMVCVVCYPSGLTRPVSGVRGVPSIFVYLPWKAQHPFDIPKHDLGLTCNF